jgi:hypothetical protein
MRKRKDSSVRMLKPGAMRMPVPTGKLVFGNKRHGREDSDEFFSRIADTPARAPMPSENMTHPRKSTSHRRFAMSENNQNFPLLRQIRWTTQFCGSPSTRIVSFRTSVVPASVNFRLMTPASHDTSISSSRTKHTHWVYEKQSAPRRRLTVSSRSARKSTLPPPSAESPFFSQPIRITLRILSGVCLAKVNLLESKILPNTAAAIASLYVSFRARPRCE